MTHKSPDFSARRAALVLAAAAAALAPLPPGLVERWYSAGVYLRWQPWITAASNRVSFALLDVLVAGIAAGWIAAAVFDRRRRRLSWGRVLARLALRSAVWTAALYLAFLLIWGLNYRRVPLADKLQFDPGAVSARAARTLAETAVAELNALHDRAHAEGWAGTAPDRERLEAVFARTERALGAPRLALTGRPKLSLFDVYFRRAGVAGMTDPFLLETLVASDLLPFERPFVLAHEWGHLAGYADESEASFVGWVACQEGPASFQYSAWISLYGDIVGSVPRSDRAGLIAPLGPGPRADLRAMADRRARDVNPAVSAAGWEVYDRYLRANRVQAGVASYAAVVRLLLGARFGPGWVPRRK